MVVFFPFETRRLDGRQGVVARQLPLMLAEAFAAAGVAATGVSFTARRGEIVAHVLLEQALPSALVVSESRERNADRAVVGRVVLDDGTYELSAQLIDVATESVLASVATSGEASHSLRTAITSLAQQLGAPLGGSATLVLPSSDDALVSWFTHLDNAALSATAFKGADAQGRWRWALDTLRLDPAFAPAIAAARALIPELTRDGRLGDATSCAIELAERTGTADDWAQAVARLPDGSRELVERVLRHTRSVELAGETHLQVGVAALRVGLADEAAPHLETATTVAATRDRAKAYLGVAFAECGRNDEAVALWNDVISKGSDTAAAAIARSNLERSAARGA